MVLVSLLARVLAKSFCLSLSSRKLRKTTATLSKEMSRIAGISQISHLGISPQRQEQLPRKEIKTPKFLRKNNTTNGREN
ncbi:hypothetical protein HDV64DRAFT_255034 [Trichoderma sp. TUCIM 5745]